MHEGGSKLRKVLGLSMRGERLAICYADCVVVWDVRWNVQNGQFGTQCLQVLSAPKELHFCSSVLFPSGESSGCLLPLSHWRTMDG